jgi:hypothetical protein
VEDELVEERLERLEALLQENGIDPNQITVTSESERHRNSTRLKVRESIQELPTPASIISEPQTTIFKPQLLHGQGGTKFVDK